jgi:hypothetical protein
MAHLRRFLATSVQYRVWIVTKRGQYTHVYYRKCPLPPTAKFAPDDPNILSDHPRDVHARALWQPNRFDVDQLISYMNPLQQYQMIRQISDPSLFETKQSQKKKRSSIKRALLHASEIVTCNPSYSAAPSLPTLYLSCKDNDLPIVIDSGASFLVSPTISDFVGAIQPCYTTHLNGLKGKINVVGEGDVEWTVQDIFGTTRKLCSTAYYIPDASVRLFSPHTYFQKWSAGSFKMDYKGTYLTLKDVTTLAFPYNAGSTLPLMLTTQYFKRSANFVGLSYADTQQLADTNQMHTFMSVADEATQNLTISQKELLLWHQRLGHADQQQIQQMLAKPVNSDLLQIIQPKNPRASAVSHVLCATCQLAKQPCTGAGMSRSIPVPRKRGGLTADKLQPGQRVSIDQYMSSTHRRLAHTKGKESKSKKFTGGILFVDHATLYIHCTNQVSLRVGETLKGKNAFKKYSKHSGADITGYHADNALFRAAKFVRDCNNKNQTMDYSGVGAHHQNGLAEGSIETVCSWARAMMLHSIIHWPGEARLDLWPMALDHSIYL